MCEESVDTQSKSGLSVSNTGTVVIRWSALEFKRVTDLIRGLKPPPIYWYSTFVLHGYGAQ